MFEHIIQIAQGIAAAAACVLFLYLVGLLLIARKDGGRILESPRTAFVGAAATILWCSYGLQLDVPLPRVLFAEVCVALVFMALRRSLLLDLLAHPTLPRRVFASLGLFACFFTLTYCFMMPPASNDYLPIVFKGNNDIFNYINCTSFLQRLGPSNIANFSFRVPFGGGGVGTYDQVPAVFYVLFGISTFFGAEPIRAAMPTMFGVVALIGCTVTWLTKVAFNLPKAVCAAVAALVISGPFFRYNVGLYFLSQILGMLVVLALLGETARILIARSPVGFREIFLSFLPFHIVLCFTYPVLAIIGLALQSGLVLIHCILDRSPRDTESVAGVIWIITLWTVGNLGGVAIAWLADPWHGILTIRNLLIVSEVGTIGWVQDFISPLAILGFPFSTQIFGRSKQLLFVAGAATFLLFFGFMLARLRPRATIGQTFYVVAALSSVLYFAYFFLVGPSYQQWKLAGCLPLTMSFAIVAAVIEVILLASDRLASRKSRYQMPAGLISFAACISLVLGNMAIYHVSEPSPPRFSSNYARLRTLENLTGVQSIFIYMESFSTTFFPVYFVRNQLLRLISPSYYSRETLHLKDISPRTPLFFEGDVCEADQYHLPLSGVGCLYFRRPTLTPDHSYQFKQTLPEIADVRGLSVREPWGRWSGAKKVALSMYANQEDIDKLPDGYINFDLSAFLPPGIPTQHVSLSWGKGRQGNLALSERGWISLPVSDQDWVTGDLRKLLIEFDLPDAISPQQVEVTNLDTRTLAIGFIAISWTVHSVGNVPGA